MHLVTRQCVRFFQFSALNGFPGLTHAVGCRLDGTSKPPYDSMNLSQGVGDNTDSLVANRNRWLQATGGGVHVYTRQNHGTTIRIIKRDSFDAFEKIQTGSESADALISDVPQVRLSILTADCQAVMLFDPEKRVVANVHCGWRGSVANILGRVVSRMTREFHCNPHRIIAAIAPSLGPCCAEFINYKSEIPRYLWPFRVGSNHFDFWRISQHQLVEAGLLEGRVYNSGICTRCNPHLFFSYRAERETGRFVSFIALC